MKVDKSDNGYEIVEVSFEKSYTDVAVDLEKLWTSEIPIEKNYKANLLIMLGLPETTGYTAIFAYLSPEDIFLLSTSTSNGNDWFEDLFIATQKQLNREKYDAIIPYFEERELMQAISLADIAVFKPNMPKFWYDNVPSEFAKSEITNLLANDPSSKQQLAEQLKEKLIGIAKSLSYFGNLSLTTVLSRELQVREFVNADDITDASYFIDLNTLLNKLAELLILIQISTPSSSVISKYDYRKLEAINKAALEMYDSNGRTFKELLLDIVEPRLQETKKDFLLQKNSFSAAFIQIERDLNTNYSAESADLNSIQIA